MTILSGGGECLH